MKKIKIILIIIIMLAGIKNSFAKDFPFTPGEQIEYAVKWNGFKIGDMVLTYWGKITQNDKEYIQISSHTVTKQYTGIDVVYVDSETFLPVKVLRKLKYLGFEEEIEEIYDQEKNILTITKTAGSKKEVHVIQKSGNIQNSILLYYLTRMKDYKIGEGIDIVLPTREYNIVVKKQDMVWDEKGVSRQAKVFKSNPRGITVWVSETNGFLPIRMVFSEILSLVTMSFKDVSYLDKQELTMFKLEDIYRFYESLQNNP